MAIVKTFTTKRVTDDGFVELEDDVPVGRHYLIDTLSERTTYLRHRSGVLHEKSIVDVVDDRGRSIGWIATELLALD